MFAKNREAAANLSSQLKANDFTKLYRAYVEGNLTREKLGRLKNAELKGTDVYIIADRMFKDSAVNMAVIVDSKNRKKDREHVFLFAR